MRTPTTNLIGTDYDLRHVRGNAMSAVVITAAIIAALTAILSIAYLSYRDAPRSDAERALQRAR